MLSTGNLRFEVVPRTQILFAHYRYSNRDMFVRATILFHPERAFNEHVARLTIVTLYLLRRFDKLTREQLEDIAIRSPLFKYNVGAMLGFQFVNRRTKRKDDWDSNYENLTDASAVNIMDGY